MIDKQFWCQKKVLITGCTGFKGSWLVIWLNMLGAKVYGYSLNAPTNPSMWDALKIESLCQSVKYADIRDYSSLSTYISLTKPDVIIHMAAQSLVRYSYKNPRETYEVNVMGTVNVLEAVRESNMSCIIVNVTTDKCYENKEWIWAYRENEPKGGYDPYSNSKACAELVTSAYYDSFFKNQDQIKLASVRAGNVIGGGDFAADRLIPDIVRSFNNNDIVNIRYPHSIRPWQHVLEPLSGYLTLAQAMGSNSQFDYSGGWNFGSREDDAKPVEWIVDHMAKLWGKPRQYHIEKDQPHEAHYLRLDCSKARMLLSWSPLWSIDNALAMLTHWYQSYFANQDLLRVTQNQIEEYMKG